MRGVAQARAVPAVMVVDQRPAHDAPQRGGHRRHAVLREGARVEKVAVVTVSARCQSPVPLAIPPALKERVVVQRSRRIRPVQQQSMKHQRLREQLSRRGSAGEAAVAALQA
jgi:hypothetical protein